MTDLLLRRVSESRAGAEVQDDYDVIVDGFVIRHEATREAAMQAFAKSWHRET